MDVCYFQSNVKTFFKSVASFLSHDNWMNIIYALSLLSISLDEPLGEKVINILLTQLTSRVTFPFKEVLENRYPPLRFSDYR